MTGRSSVHSSKRILPLKVTANMRHTCETASLPQHPIMKRSNMFYVFTVENANKHGINIGISNVNYVTKYDSSMPSDFTDGIQCTSLVLGVSCMEWYKISDVSKNTAALFFKMKIVSKVFAEMSDNFQHLIRFTTKSQSPSKYDNEHFLFQKQNFNLPQREK
jgi:hypothetical protein